MERRYVSQGTKYQHFICFDYQAGGWEAAQRCITKVESTGKGLNIRYIVSNLPDKSNGLLEGKSTVFLATNDQHRYQMLLFGQYHPIEVPIPPISEKSPKSIGA